jgi:hypothetical protein
LGTVLKLSQNRIYEGRDGKFCADQEADAKDCHDIENVCHCALLDHSTEAAITLIQ